MGRRRKGILYLWSWKYKAKALFGVEFSENLLGWEGSRLAAV